MPAPVNEDKSTRYHRLRRRADLSGTAVAGIVLLVLAVSGAGVRIREGFQAIAGAVLPAGLDEPATVVLVTIAVLVILQVVEFPFAWYQGFALEHRYGLSTQKGAHWLADHVKATAVGMVLAVAAASVVFTTLRRWPDGWWVLSAAIFVAAMVALARLAPVLLLPLFYRFRPLDRPQLAERLMALATRARTDVVGVFEWVLSGHTRKANAALAGLGQTRRILLSDTLLADYTDDEIEVVLAHELAHHVHRDLWRGIALQVVVVVGGFFFADLLLRAAGGWLQYRGLSDPAAIPLLMLTGGAWSFVMLPIANALSRAQERAADRYALETTRNPEAFVSAMRRLSQQNMAEDRPSTLVRLLFYSHPPIRERIEAARAFTRM
ncbi:MAG TPA: M48 family metalloprotease [Vicinamibacterales bacterium]|nr:M48 family metalloprotease [Vicinamibacterales bacterium]